MDLQLKDCDFGKCMYGVSYWSGRENRDQWFRLESDALAFAREVVAQGCVCGAIYKLESVVVAGEPSRVFLDQDGLIVKKE